MIEIYMAESVLLKTEKLVERTSEEACKEIAMVQLNLFNAIEDQFKGKKPLYLLQKR